MAQYQIQSPDGHTVTVEGDAPPTQEDAAQIFKAIPDVAPKGTFAGVSSQMHEMTQDEDFATKNNLSSDSAKFIRENTRPGIPFDFNAALPAGIRARVSVESDPQKQADLLAKQPGILNARNVDGRVVATINGEDGKPKDVLLHPENFTDVAGNTVPIAKTAAATGLAVATDGASLPLTAGIMGGGMAAIDAGSKALSRASAGQDIDPADIAKSAAKEGVINAALPVLGKAVQGTRGILASGAGPLEENTIAAGERLGVPITPAQATGSSVLSRSTALPGTGGEALATAQKGALKAATDRELGGSGANAIPSEASIAPKVAGTIAENAGAADAETAQAMKDAASGAQKEIQDTLDKGLVPSNLPQSDAGKFIKGKVEALRDQFQQEAAKNYGTAYDLAAKENLRIPTDPIKKLAEEISSKDPQGALQQLVPEIGRIFKVSAQLETPVVTHAGEETGMTLPQAIELRAVVNDKIARGEAVGDIPGRYLKNLAGALTEAIDTGVKSGSPELQSAFNTAKTAYAKDIGKFTSSDIAKLFTDPESGRYLGDSEVIPALFRGKGNLDALQAYKGVLGANSPEYKLLLRQGVNNIMDESGTTGGLLNADKFLTRINGLSKEMQQEVLGPHADTIAGNARLMTVARGGKIDPDDLANALANTPGQTPQLLQRAITKQNAADYEYNTGIMQQLRNGTLSPKSVGNNPDTFVTRFVNNASTDDVKNVLTQLGQKSPETVEAIRQRTLANLLEDVGAKAKVGQATTGENIALNSEKLTKDYLTGTNRGKYEAILGPKGIQFLDDLATVHESMAKEALQARGSPLSSVNRAAYVAGDALPGDKDVIKTSIRALAAGPQFVLGNAQRSAAVRDFLSTGQLPDIGTIPRALLLASPEATTERRQALAQQRGK